MAKMLFFVDPATFDRKLTPGQLDMVIYIDFFLCLSKLVSNIITLQKNTYVHRNKEEEAIKKRCMQFNA